MIPLLMAVSKGEEIEIRLAQMKDYSGDFKPDLKYQDFTKDTLAALLVEVGRAMIAIDGYWHTRFAEKFGDVEADKWGAWVWGTMYPKHVIPRIRKVLNIQGDDVYSWAKYTQMDPGLPIGMYDSTFTILNRNHVIWSCNNCPSYLYMVREGKGRENIVCGVGGLEDLGISGYAHAFNPAIKVTRLQGAPLKSKDQHPHCQWELKLEPKK